MSGRPGLVTERRLRASRSQRLLGKLLDLVQFGAPDLIVRLKVGNPLLEHAFMGAIGRPKIKKPLANANLRAYFYLYEL